MLLQAINVLVYFLPAIFADGTPPVFRKFPFVKKIYVPINDQLLGTHKTWGGCWVALTTGTIVGAMLIPASPYTLPAPLAGLLLGFGSSVGDIVGSYFKRVFGKKPGEYVLLDSFDWLVGAWIIRLVLTDINLFVIGVSLVLVPVVILVNYICFKFTSIKDNL